MKATAQMGGLTRKDVEKWREHLIAEFVMPYDGDDGQADLAASNSFDVNALCDLALQSLSIESVRPEAQEWRVTENGNLICSEDFTFDAMLKLDGDFADDAQRIQYAEAIAAKLNALSPARVAEEKAVHENELRK